MLYLPVKMCKTEEGNRSFPRWLRNALYLQLWSLLISICQSHSCYCQSLCIGTALPHSTSPPAVFRTNHRSCSSNTSSLWLQYIKQGSFQEILRRTWKTHVTSGKHKEHVWPWEDMKNRCELGGYEEYMWPSRRGCIKRQQEKQCSLWSVEEISSNIDPSLRSKHHKSPRWLLG